MTAKRPPRTPSLRHHKASKKGFVELDAAQLIGRGEGATSVLELSSADGAKLLVRLEGHDTLDVAALVAAFWGRDR